MTTHIYKDRSTVFSGRLVTQCFYLCCT